MKTLIALILLIPTSSYAVEGYKDIKFGISIEQLRKKKPCHLTDTDKISGAPNGLAYSCMDYAFNGSKTSAIFLFIDKKLLRIAINAGSTPQDAAILVNGLNSKYGKPNFDPQLLKAFENNKALSWLATWDNSTVQLQLSHNGDEIMIMLFYQDKSWDTAKQAALKDDL
jgi:hypothetical protein